LAINKTDNEGVQHLSWAATCSGPSLPFIGTAGETATYYYAGCGGRGIKSRCTMIEELRTMDKTKVRWKKSHTTS
jgi:hypothetical protein